MELKNGYSTLANLDSFSWKVFLQSGVARLATIYKSILKYSFCNYLKSFNIVLIEERSICERWSPAMNDRLLIILISILTVEAGFNDALTSFKVASL